MCFEEVDEAVKEVAPVPVDVIPKGEDVGEVEDAQVEDHEDAEVDGPSTKMPPLVL